MKTNNNFNAESDFHKFERKIIILYPPCESNQQSTRTTSRKKEKKKTSHLSSRCEFHPSMKSKTYHWQCNIHYPAWIIICMETRYSAPTHFNRSNNISIPQVVHVTLLSRHLSQCEIHFRGTPWTTCRRAGSADPRRCTRRTRYNPRDINVKNESASRVTNSGGINYSLNDIVTFCNGGKDAADESREPLITLFMIMVCELLLAITDECRSGVFNLFQVKKQTV